MPQTRSISPSLRLLGVHAGVVALTKSDLVDDEWIALVRDDVRRRWSAARSPTLR
jgi:selenocysteine-specific elongation factor